MIYTLCHKHRKDIAFGFMCLFFVSGLASAKAEVNRSYIAEGNSRISQTSFVKSNIHQPEIINAEPPGTASKASGAVNVISSEMISEKKATVVMPLSGDDIGPGQPEMSTFKPVSSDNLVSLFSGDFSYNIPLLDVGGYPINAFYNSGISMDQESSWVGLGWNINPGTITRNMRGVPDDFNGKDIIKKEYNIRPDKTWGVSGGVGLKFTGFPLSLGLNAGISFNNKLGVALEAGIHPSLSISSKNADTKTSGLSYGASIGANLSLNSRSGASITPSISFQQTQHNGDAGNSTASIGAGYTYNSRLGVTGMHLDAGYSKSKTETQQHTYKDGSTETEVIRSASGSMGALNSSLSFLYPTVTPSSTTPFTRKSYNISLSMGGEIFALNGHVRLAGYYTESRIAAADRVTYHPAYGVLNYQEANNDKSAMLDFNRANDGVYTPNSPAIAMPIYTYDIFSINGEGTGGVFRAYRSDLGFMRDPNVLTRDDAGSLGLDLGFGNTLHGGIEMSYAYTPTEVGAWNQNNAATSVFKFQKNHGEYQSVYLKNPGEKTIPDATFQENVGGEALSRLKLMGIKSATPMLIPKLVNYDQQKNVIGEVSLSQTSFTNVKRDKRTQVINFLSAEEAEKVALDKKIYYYKAEGQHENKVYFSVNCNKNGLDSVYRDSENPDNNTTEDYRKSHHISEIDVLGSDGRKYVYGIPVYNINQVEATFNISNGNTATGKSSYLPGTDDMMSSDDEDSDGNHHGRDYFVEKQTMPAFTHSFLLTALISPNYVDVSGNGITEDDMGDAIKFNYSKYNENYKWRTPTETNKASYSEGLKTDPKDDKAHYVYGEREVYYLYSIESKNLVARFFVKNDRKDGRSAAGISGGLGSGGMRRLDRISLYSKADLVKLGDNAKPIKTVKFFQSYKLCKNQTGSTNIVQGYGKLTLDSIWFSYNANNREYKSRYVFYYPTGDQNPDYDYHANDRWGNYKPMYDGAGNSNPNNPGTLKNSDFPYSIQDKTKADKYAGAWTMNKILLPSGGTINVEYESDDYAFVQERRASQMCSIVGFGSSPNPSSTERTNNYLYNSTGYENPYVYIKLPEAITGNSIIEKYRNLKTKYFSNGNQLYMKIAVVMPPSPGIAGAEYIPVYADIEQFGLVEDDLAFVKVQSLENGRTPMVQQSLQFLRQQLPGKAYPGYDVSEQNTGEAIITALASIASSVSALAIGDENKMKRDFKCSEVQTQNSFARLTSPSLKKLGGGLRVKKVIINDNWNKMTNQYDATYGQEYKYTKIENINQKAVEISSGVASWEPSIGQDENPYKEIMRYMNHNKGGPYDFGAIELPLGEVFYPSPSVGYSRVEALSIHRVDVKNKPTRQVSEFFTTRDFPFKSSCTQLNDREASVKYEPAKILQLLKLDMKKAITQSQGFLVDMNDMNGKAKMQATYTAIEGTEPISKTEYFYNIKKATNNTYSFDHELSVVESPDGQVTKKIVGRDIEVMADFREHTSETTTTNINVNFDFFFLGIFPIPLTNLLQPVIHEGTTYRSASLLKIVNHYGILDSVVSINNGSMVSTRNLVFDAETGDPLLTRTNNEHNTPLYNFSYPAHWAYSGMGPAYKNIDYTYEGLTFKKGKLETPGIDLSVFESGDELYVLSQNNYGPNRAWPCDPPAIINLGFFPIPHYGPYPKNNENKIWVINSGKVGSATPQLFFIDKDGNPYSAVNVKLRIIRSGHRNMLDQSVGSITCRVYPINSSNQLDLSDKVQVIQTGAVTYKDNWRVDNAFYRFEETVRTDQPMNLISETFNPISNLSISDSHCDKNSAHQFRPFYNQDYFNTEYHSHGRKNGNTKSMRYTQSWAMFDFSSIPSDAKIVSAKLSLYSHILGPIISTVNHVQPLACNVTSQHEKTNPHNDIGRNIFYITRAKKNWSSSFNNDNWFDFLYNSSYLDYTSMIGGGPTGTPDKSYLCGNYGDTRLDVTQMVSKMISENRNPALNFPTGIRISYKPWISSSFKDWNRNTDLPRVCFEKPAIKVTYYSCSQTGRNDGGENNYGITCPVNLPTYYCTSYQHVVSCPSIFSRKFMNPYVQGVLGNWRVDKSYVYYGERKENRLDNKVDTRTSGYIEQFTPFWNWADPNVSNPKYISRNTDNENVWVWNSQITQYNRKGYEIENRDPLGRYNAGLYGYNQQLPVAAANNARVREIMYDGFEDHDYKTASNCIDCKPTRSVHFENLENKIVSEQRHTGKYSLKVMPDDNVRIIAPVISNEVSDRDYSLRVKVDSVGYGNVQLTSNANGTGLEATYYTHAAANTALVPGSSGSTLVYTGTEIPYIANTTGTSGNGHVTDYFSVKWKGIYQVPVTGNFQFFFFANRGYRMKLNGVQVTANSNWSFPNVLNFGTTPQYNWSIGQTVQIEIDFYSFQGAQQFQLFARINGQMKNLSVNNLYPPGTTVFNTTVPDHWCTTLDEVQVKDNALTDTFSLTNERKMLLSAWVKENTSDCKCSSYVKNNITVSYVGSSETVVMEPTGNIIEGWQRYESVFVIPSTATSIQVKLNNISGNTGTTIPVYFDDLRIQPFNANMKSFVYHPSNLRLMAELDENNYASFYEYDNDGTLARVKKETEKGIKTITETRSAMQKLVPVQ